MSHQRQLAAIMFTDIEGYTSMMHSDEQGAVLLRKRHREIFEKHTKAFHGTIIQYFGDGTLSIFKSTVEAVDCAIALQRDFLSDPKIPVRIGIHVGDIIQSKDDIMGDAVNIASRIESCAVPGSILISDKVHDQIRSQNHITSEFLDAYELKNVDGAMPVFAIANEGLVIPKADEIKGKFKSVPERELKRKSSRKNVLFFMLGILLAITGVSYFQLTKKPDVSGDPSIAVLPFDNLSADSDAEIFRDGITEDILTHLSKLGELKVISRTSVMQFKNTRKTIPEIAKELGVLYILEGSIRKYGDEIRVTAQLIDAKNDEHIWADNYDKTITDIFEIQSEVSREIVNALQLNISFEEQQDLASIPTENIDAYKLFLQGRKEADKRNTESIARSIELYKKAIELDPKYAEAYAEIANSTFLQTYYGRANPAEASEKARSYLSKAEKLNNRISRIYTVKGLLYNHMKEFDKAKAAFEKAIKLSPNDVTARHQYATFFYYTEQYDKQLQQTEIAYKLDPLSFATASNYFTALTFNKKYDDAKKLIKNIEENYTEADRFVINRLYMRLYMSMPDYKKALEPLIYLSREDPAYLRFLGHSYGQLGDTLNAYKTIKQIKMLEPHRMQNHRIAVVFSSLRKADSVLYYLDSTRNKSKLFHSNMINYFDWLKDSDAYQSLLQQHGIE